MQYEERALADSVRPEQAEPLAAPHLEAHTFQHFAPAIARVHVPNIQYERIHAFAPARRCQTTTNAAIGSDHRCSRVSIAAMAASESAIFASGCRPR